jgi:outer membrane protein
MLRSCLVLALVWMAFAPHGLFAADAAESPLTLAEAIQGALAVNIDAQSAAEEIRAAEANRRIQQTQFLPTFSATYRYEHLDEERVQRIDIPGVFSSTTVVTPQDEYTLATSVSQPLFTGFALLNRYRIAGLGLEVAQLRERLTQQNVVFETKRRYFAVLRAEKLRGVAIDTIRQITAQRDVADSFYQVGMTPRNDLLQAQVELANAEQALVVAENDLSIARANFNLLLRRPLDTTVRLADVSSWTPYQQALEECQQLAVRNRLEIQLAARDVQLADREVDLARRDLWPAVNLQATLAQFGDQPTVDGGTGINDESAWSVAAVATWNFWEWGRTLKGVDERRSRLRQAQLRQQDIDERVQFEVHQAYLRTKDSEKNITTVATAIEQAQENLRINEERYREQVATATDVLIAQTLLSRTMTNYTNALYNFYLAKASLDLAMGVDLRQ